METNLHEVRPMSAPMYELVRVGHDGGEEAWATSRTSATLESIAANLNDKADTKTVYIVRAVAVPPLTTSTEPFPFLWEVVRVYRNGASFRVAASVDGNMADRFCRGLNVGLTHDLYRFEVRAVENQRAIIDALAPQDNTELRQEQDAAVMDEPAPDPIGGVPQARKWRCVRCKSVFQVDPDHPKNAGGPVNWLCAECRPASAVSTCPHDEKPCHLNDSCDACGVTA